jgi:hypothetical protein
MMLASASSGFASSMPLLDEKTRLNVVVANDR